MCCSKGLAQQREREKRSNRDTEATAAHRFQRQGGFDLTYSTTEPNSLFDGSIDAPPWRDLAFAFKTHAHRVGGPRLRDPESALSSSHSRKCRERGVCVFGVRATHVSCFSNFVPRIWWAQSLPLVWPSYADSAPCLSWRVLSSASSALLAVLPSEPLLDPSSSVAG